MKDIKDVIRLKILSRLKSNLNGKCSNSYRTCPKRIANTVFVANIVWECSDCVKIFEDIVDLEMEVKLFAKGPEYDSFKINPCPCCSPSLEADTVLARLDEEIERLSDKIATDASLGKDIKITTGTFDDMIKDTN